MRKLEITINNDKLNKLYKAVEFRQKVSEEALVLEEEKGKLEDRLKEIQEIVQKKVHEVNRHIDKAQPIIKNIKDGWEMKEFENVGKLYIEDSKLYVEINDQVEDFKLYLKTEKQKELDKEKEEEDQIEEEAKKALKKHE
jgi:hypothetical protein